MSFFIISIRYSEYAFVLAAVNFIFRVVDSLIEKEKDNKSAMNKEISQATYSV